jgi:hypothetical protein
MKNRAYSPFVVFGFFVEDLVLHPLFPAVIATLASTRNIISIYPARKPANDRKLRVFAHFVRYKVSVIQPCVLFILLSKTFQFLMKNSLTPWVQRANLG